MRTRIISAFPGTGKTTYWEKNKDTALDSDSSQFSWTTDGDGNKTRNPEFPANYIEHIKENIGKYETILVSSHKEVRQALIDSSIFFYAVYPHPRRKDEFMERYRSRGSDESFIRLVSDNWDEWIREGRVGVGFEYVNMVLPYLEDEIRHIETSESGDLRSA